MVLNSKANKEMVFELERRYYVDFMTRQKWLEVEVEQQVMQSKIDKKLQWVND